MVIKSVTLRVLVLASCWLIVGYSMHMFIHNRLLAYTLFYTQQQAQHANAQTLTKQIEQEKKQEEQLRTFFNETIETLVINQPKSLIELAHSANALTIRSFVPRTSIDHGWYTEEVIELMLEGPCSEILTYLNQAGSYAQLTSVSWTVLKSEYAECAMTWHSYSVNNEKLGVSCQPLTPASIFSIPENKTNSAPNRAQTHHQAQPLLRGIISRDTDVAALIYYKDNYCVVTEGDVIDTYQVVAIRENSIIVHHYEKGDVVISL